MLKSGQCPFKKQARGTSAVFRKTFLAAKQFLIQNYSKFIRQSEISVMDLHPIQGSSNTSSQLHAMESGISSGSMGQFGPRAALSFILIIVIVKCVAIPW